MIVKPNRGEAVLFYNQHPDGKKDLVRYTIHHVLHYTPCVTPYTMCYTIYYVLHHTPCVTPYTMFILFLFVAHAVANPSALPCSLKRGIHWCMDNSKRTSEKCKRNHKSRGKTPGDVSTRYCSQEEYGMAGAERASCVPARDATSARCQPQFLLEVFWPFLDDVEQYSTVNCILETKSRSAVPASRKRYRAPLRSSLRAPAASDLLRASPYLTSPYLTPPHLNQRPLPCTRRLRFS